ncbi:hypothetical protein GT347_20190 [Xylophilus rhododendri]|uniref:DUF6475 domain-containing protein n=1 Tax=Xylophilus rhododendri TaxID=2697032 RepID=A0A857J7Z9_9BURK|nr:DUF6475 domain-containing protein [Xylophilus rhododendri]QHJ00095.1 hypothetical protein GT347_20190 [Xylophilus rhododendri]
MLQREKAEFGQLVKDVMAYYRQDTSAFLLDTWWGACQGFGLEQVKTAMQRHATDAEHGQFAPKVADVVRILAGTATDRAALAWGKVHDAMSRVGAYSDVVFDDPAIHAAVEDCGGWPKLCRTELAELSYLQHRFQAAHRAYTERGEFDYPRLLKGAAGPDNAAMLAKRGLPAPEPAFIGDPKRALRVFQAGGAGKTAITYQSVADQALRGLPTIGGAQ